MGELLATAQYQPDDVVEFKIVATELDGSNTHTWTSLNLLPYQFVQPVAPVEITPAPVTPGDPLAITDVDQITLSTETPGASIRYTTDGRDPSPTFGTIYSSALTLPVSATVKAMADAIDVSKVNYSQENLDVVIKELSRHYKEFMANRNQDDSSPLGASRSRFGASGSYH